MVVKQTLVSACLAGRSCIAADAHRDDPELVAAERTGRVVGVCPALEGGLCLSEEDVYLDGGSGVDVLKGRARVRTGAGQDVTDQAVLGVVKVMQVVRAGKFTEAILRADTALCGVGSAPDWDGAPVGDGLLAAALRCQGVPVREVRGESGDSITSGAAAG